VQLHNDHSISMVPLFRCDDKNPVRYRWKDTEQKIGEILLGANSSANSNNWEALDKPCFGLLESTHSDPHVHGPASASSDPSNNLSAETLPQHMTAQELSDWLVQIFTNSSKPLGSDDRPLSSRSKAATIHVQEQHHTAAHQISNPTAEVGALANICANAVHSREALNFDGLPSGEWF
jgi:hypothetical protein